MRSAGTQTGSAPSLPVVWGPGDPGARGHPCSLGHGMSSPKPSWREAGTVSLLIRAAGGLCTGHPPGQRTETPAPVSNARFCSEL